jgi:hypothetical protein
MPVGVPPVRASQRDLLLFLPRVRCGKWNASFMSFVLRCSLLAATFLRWRSTSAMQRAAATIPLHRSLPSRHQLPAGVSPAVSLLLPAAAEG